MLHFAVQGLNAMEEVESQIGLKSNTSEQSKNLDSQIFDGDQMRPSFRQNLQSKSPSSIKVQVKIILRSTANVCSYSRDAWYTKWSSQFVARRSLPSHP